MQTHDADTDAVTWQLSRGRKARLGELHCVRGYDTLPLLIQISPLPSPLHLHHADHDQGLWRQVRCVWYGMSGAWRGHGGACLSRIKGVGTIQSRPCTGAYPLPWPPYKEGTQAPRLNQLAGHKVVASPSHALAMP